MALILSQTQNTKNVTGHFDCVTAIDGYQTINPVILFIKRSVSKLIFYDSNKFYLRLPYTTFTKNTNHNIWNFIF